ncbi:MAG: cupin domain-containing protein [Thalassotalea sp.]
MKLYQALLPLLFLTTSNTALSNTNELDSTVITSETAKTTQHEWGTLITYYNGETAGTKDAFSAVAIINPGMEIHPPHEHSEEEYLMILAGSGTWILHDKSFEAKTGDILFAKPWDNHGLKNTGKTPLKFVVFKWNNKLLAELKKH